MNPVMHLVELGWKLVPAKPKSKEAILPWHLAITDPVAVKRWLKTDCNWMVCLGDDLIAIDVENLQGHGALRKIHREMLAKHGAGLPICPEAVSGGARAGYHLYMLRSKGDTHRCNGSTQEGDTVPVLRNHLRLGTEIEVRTGPLLLTIPPSRHAVTGDPYFWEHGRAPWEIVPPPAPEWLLEMMAPPPLPERKPVDLGEVSDAYVQAAIRKEIDERLLLAESGMRNETLNRSAYSLFRLVDKADASVICEALLDGARQIGLGEHEATMTIKSAARARGVKL